MTILQILKIQSLAFLANFLPASSLIPFLGMESKSLCTLKLLKKNSVSKI